MARSAEERSRSGWERVHCVVRRVPRGRVASYGQIAMLAGMPGAARQVGYALAGLGPESTIPWHRVVNAQGTISLRADSDGAPLQRARLEAEGIVFGAAGRIDLARFGWRPGARAAAERARTGRTKSPHTRNTS